MKNLLIIMTLFSMLSCAATAPRLHQFENKRTFNYSFDKIWDAVIETFAEKNIPISNMEKVSGFIASQETRVPSVYADCGATPLGVAFNSALPVIGSFNVFVKELSPNNYSVLITSSYRVVTDNMFYKYCVSTGYLENRFLTILEQKLSSK